MKTNKHKGCFSIMIFSCFILLWGCSDTQKNQLSQTEANYDKELKNLENQISNDDTIGLKSKVDSFVCECISLMQQFPNSSLACRIMTDLYYDMNDVQREKGFSLLPQDSLKNNHRLKMLHNAFLKQKASCVGSTYIDFGGLTPNGDSLYIHDLLHNTDYVLIDFWASWCPSCCRNMPALREFYKKYNNKVEIVGVSLDRKRDAWLTAIDTLHLPWKQISDLKGWDCEFSALYGVCAIPALVLINKKGIICSRNNDISEWKRIMDIH